MKIKTEKYNFLWVQTIRYLVSHLQSSTRFMYTRGIYQTKPTENVSNNGIQRNNAEADCLMPQRGLAYSTMLTNSVSHKLHKNVAPHVINLLSENFI